MGYEDELPNSLGHTGLALDESIKTRLQSIDVNPDSTNFNDNDIKTVDKTEIVNDENLPNEVFAIDGSRAEVNVGKPSHNSKVGFVEVSTVQVNSDLLRSAKKLDKPLTGIRKRCIDSEDVRLVVPSMGTIIEGDLPVEKGWRKYTYLALKNKTLFGRSLYSSYIDLLSLEGIVQDSGIQLSKCPNCGTKDDDGNEKQQEVPIDVKPEDPYSCDYCNCDIYPTDKLRIYEKVNSRQPNVGALTVLMNVFEHICFHSIIHNKRTNNDFQNMGFLKDGPLAQFDTASWIGRGMREYLSRMIGDIGSDSMPVIIGLHKSGEFHRFATQIREETKTEDKYDISNKQFVVPLSSESIYKYVVPQPESDEWYGKRNYYGKNFIYRSSDRHVFPLTIPRRIDENEDHLKYRTSEYPLLGRAIETLEDLRLELYEDSIIPIHMAHTEATIPENVGDKVLREMSNQEILNSNRIYDR